MSILLQSKMQSNCAVLRLCTYPKMLHIRDVHGVFVGTRAQAHSGVLALPHTIGVSFELCYCWLCRLK